MSAPLLPGAATLVPELRSYDHVILFTSGGKDATACLVELLERGVPPARIEMHHHEVDVLMNTSGNEERRGDVSVR